MFLGNGLVAILAGLLGHGLVETLDLGPVAPFDAAAATLLIGGVVIVFTWSENFGDSSDKVLRPPGPRDERQGACAGAGAAGPHCLLHHHRRSRHRRASHAVSELLVAMPHAVRVRPLRWQSRNEGPHAGAPAGGAHNPMRVASLLEGSGTVCRSITLGATAGRPQGAGARCRTSGGPAGCRAE